MLCNKFSLFASKQRWFFFPPKCVKMQDINSFLYEVKDMKKH